MKEERVWATVAYEPTVDKIFIMGGVGNAYNNVDTCEQYDINQNKLTQFSKLNQQKATMTASILNNRFIYLFGGSIGNNQVLDTIEQYDIMDRQTWEIVDIKLPKPL